MNKKLTQTAVLAGICIMLTVTGLGFIRTPLLSITIMHLPVIIGTLIVGKKEGLFLGLLFGSCSWVFNIIAPTATSFVFYNPMVSVLPRIMIPVAVILAGMATTNVQKDLRVGICSAVGSITNTVLVLSMIYVFYAERYAQVLGIAKEAVVGALMTTVLVNGLPEAVIVSVLAIAIVRIMKKDLEV